MTDAALYAFVCALNGNSVYSSLLDHIGAMHQITSSYNLLIITVPDYQRCCKQLLQLGGMTGED